jgi:hypothetical protein
MKREFIEGVHYYLENGKVVLSAEYHTERGYCCGNKCRHCPFTPKYERGNIKIEETYENDYD